MRPRIAVDWDDTCVDGVWPERDGAWKPGAIEALRELSKHARVVIFTTRIAPVQPEWMNYTVRDAADVRAEILTIRNRLDEEGLTSVEVWDKPWKVDNCIAYVDDKAVHYTGKKTAWRDLTDKLIAMAQTELDGRLTTSSVEATSK